MKISFLFCVLLTGCLFFVPHEVSGKVTIDSYKVNSWDNSWNDAINEELSEEGASVMMNSPLDEDDLNELSCPGLNAVTDNNSKKDFWVVFFSALVRAESAFNQKVRSHGNYGLLQLSKATARAHCGMTTMEEIKDGMEQVRCGVKLMSWQLQGAPSAKGKLLRPDLQGQLFGKHILLWGPLRQNDKRGRELLVNWFKKHLDQLPFCKSQEVV